MAFKIVLFKLSMWLPYIKVNLINGVKKMHFVLQSDSVDGIILLQSLLFKGLNQ